MLERHLPRTAAWVYGSRAKWTARTQSDLDLVVFATPEQSGRVGALREAVEEDDLPFPVDLFVWDDVPKESREQIETEHVVLVDGRTNGMSVEMASGMAGEWREENLDQLGKIVTGKTPPSSGVGYFGGDIPFVTPTDLDGRRLIDTTARYLTESGARIVGHSRIPIGSVMISCIGSDMGKAAITACECVTNQQINSIVVESDDDPMFVYYNLSNRKAEIRAAAGGSAQPILNKSGFGQFRIGLPPLPEQRAIAHVLGTLDDKIELNRRKNETLEAMARALFKSWFVDFDPVRAKLESRDTGLPNNIADLFPDQMVESELGEIPEGWEVGCLADIAVAPRRGIDPTDLRGETPYIGLEHMPRRSIALTDWEGTGKVTSNKSFFEKGEFLFGKLRPYFHKVGIAPISGVCSTDIVVIAPRSAIWSAFLLATISSVAFVNYTDQTSTGTKMPRTSWKTMSRYAMCLPTDTGARAFQKAMGPILARTVANIHENRTLAVLRETLLPKLISGEIRARHTKAQQLIGHT